MAKSSRINERQHTVAHERKNGPFPRTVFSFSFSFWLEIEKNRMEWGQADEYTYKYYIWWRKIKFINQ